MVENLLNQAFDRNFNLIIEAKEEGGSLLTLDAFKEMMELDWIIYNNITTMTQPVKSENGIILIGGG